MNKAKITFVIIAVIIVLVVIFYYINKSVLPTVTTDMQGRGKNSESEKVPFDTNDNLDQAIEELNLIDNI
ncbi:MAG: hypothetical protein AAB340_00960 [Patescibacteria group bacterium]